jgi:predicted DNA-binding transcriptional regulator AlpA
MNIDPTHVVLHLTVTLDQRTLDALAVQLTRAIATALSTRTVASARAGGDSNEQGRLLWTLREVAKALNVCEKTVWNLRRAGKMPPPIQLGRVLRWDPETIRRWLASEETW